MSHVIVLAAAPLAQAAKHRDVGCGAPPFTADRRPVASNDQRPGPMLTACRSAATESSPAAAMSYDHVASCGLVYVIVTRATRRASRTPDTVVNVSRQPPSPLRLVKRRELGRRRRRAQHTGRHRDVVVLARCLDLAGRGIRLRPPWTGSRQR